METKYKKPIYDPFEIFNPSKAFIELVIKDLRNQCYELLQENQNDKSGFSEICNKPRLDQLNKKINDYKWRIRNSRNKNESGNTRISKIEIERAKSVPITDFYNGKLRRSGKNLVGCCPFHQEKTGSFTIFNQGTRFKCFGCGESGDSIHYIQKSLNLNFIQAIKYILKI